MVRLFRYLLVLGGLVALAWASVTVDLGGRTLYGHLSGGAARPALEGASGWLSGLWEGARARWVAWRAPAPAATPKPAPAAKGTPKAKVAAPAPKPTPAGPAPSPVEVQSDPGAKKRVALLKSAAQATEPAAAPARTAPRTRVDEKISGRDKAALDALLTRRDPGR